jgi:hypothetical protein
MSMVPLQSNANSPANDMQMVDTYPKAVSNKRVWLHCESQESSSATHTHARQIETQKRNFRPSKYLRIRLRHCLAA